MATCSAENHIHLDNVRCSFSNSECKVQFTRFADAASIDTVCGDLCSIHTQTCVPDSSTFKCIELGAELCVHELAEACYGLEADKCLTVNGCMIATECEAREDVCETEDGCSRYSIGDCHWHGDSCESDAGHKSEVQLSKQSLFDGLALAIWGVGVALNITAGKFYNSTYAKYLPYTSFFCLGALFFLSSCVGIYECIFYATEIEWTIGGIYVPWIIISGVYLICQLFELLEGLYAPYVRIYISGTIIDFALACSIVLLGGYPAIVLAFVAAIYGVTTMDEKLKWRFSLLSLRGPIFGIILVFTRPHMGLITVSALQSIASGVLIQFCISQLKGAKINTSKDLMRVTSCISLGIIVFAVVYCLWYNSGYSLSLFVFHQLLGSESAHEGHDDHGDHDGHDH